MLIEISSFKGEIPIAHAKQLPIEHAQEATNVDLSQNILKPFYEIGDVKTLNTTAWRNIFPVKYQGAIFWLCTTQESNVLNVAIQDPKGRFYYSDGVQIKESNWSLASNDGTSTYGTPNTSYYLGPPKPEGTFVAAATEADDNVKGDVVGSISYVYTFVTDWGYEGEPSDPTRVIDIYEGQYVELGNFEIPVPSDYNIVGIRIYRTSVGSTGNTEFQLLTQTMKHLLSPDYITPAEIIANGYIWDDRATIDDEISADTDLGEVIACTDYVLPPVKMEGLIALPNNVTAGYKGRTVYIAEPYIHYGYPADYQMVTDFDIKSIGWYGTTIVVGTEGNPYKINGYDPQNLSKEKQPDPQACLFSRAMVNGPRFVLYPSPDGLYMVSDEKTGNVTAGIFTKEQWRALLTDLVYYDKTIIAFLYDEKYYAFFEGTNEGFIIDFNSASQFYANFELDSTVSVYGGYVDLVDDALYLLTEIDSTYYIKKWEGFHNLEVIQNIKTESEDRFLVAEDGSRIITTGTDGITEDWLLKRWKSRIFVTYQAFFSCMKIDGDFIADLTGTGLIVSDGLIVTGTDTDFITELAAGYVFYNTVLKEYREIASVENDTSLTLVSAFSSDTFDVTYYDDEVIDDDYYEDGVGEKYHVTIPIPFKYNTALLNIYKDDTLFFTRAINSLNPFRVPSGRGRNWEIEIVGIKEEVNIKMAQAMAELA